jgi:hypothetical protein
LNDIALKLYLKPSLQAETIFVVFEPLIDPNVFNSYVENPDYYVPYAFNLSKTTQMKEILEVGASFRQLYFGGKAPTANMMEAWVQFQTDHVFAFGIDRTIKSFANHSNVPVYYYRFSMDGALNAGKRTAGMAAFPGAMHIDVENCLSSS